MSLSTDDKIREYVMKKAQQREHARQLREARKSLAKGVDADDVVQPQYNAVGKDSFTANEETSSHYPTWAKEEAPRMDLTTRGAPVKTFTNPSRVDNSYAGVSAAPSHIRTSLSVEAMGVPQPSPKYATMDDVEKVKSFLDQLQGQMHSLQFQIDNLKYSNQRLTDQVAFLQREAADNSARGYTNKSTNNSNTSNNNIINNNNNNNNNNNIQTDMGYSNSVSSVSASSSSYGGGYLASRNSGQQSSPSLQGSNNNSMKPMSVDNRNSKSNGDNFYGNSNSNSNSNSNGNSNNNNNNNNNGPNNSLYNRNKPAPAQNMVGEKNNQNWGSNTTRNNGPTAMDIDSRLENQQVNEMMKANNKSNSRNSAEFRPFSSNSQNNADMPAASNASTFTFQTRENSGSKLLQHEPMDISADKLQAEQNLREQESDAENQAPMSSSAAELLAKLGPEAFPDPQSNEEKVECPQCNRKFNSDSALEKHVKACMKKRKIFDASKMRMDDEALKAKCETDANSDKNKKTEKWKNQSGALREAIKAAREYNQAKKEGREPPPPIQSSVPDTRVGCPYCGRKFNEDAAERHIPKCKNIKSKPKPLGKK